MRPQLRLTRPERSLPAARRLPPPVVRARPVIRPKARAPAIGVQAPLPSPAWPGFAPDPYLDYGRFLTAEGGILIIYKDLDLRLRHTLWRLFAWTAATGGDSWLLLWHSPVKTVWINVALLVAAALINWLIVAKPVEVYRRIEVRSDCLIIEAEDVFWSRNMEGGWPGFQRDQEGNQVLCGVYGTRFVEYLTVRRFDELDRMPEVFAAHLNDAMEQLWTRNWV